MNTRFHVADVLVLCLALLILAALLLPLIEDSRPRRRAECAAHIAELAKATQQFEMGKKRYPGVLEAFGQNDEGQVKVGTWAVALLPYIESEPLYDLWADPTTTAEWNNARGPVDYVPANRLFHCDLSDQKGQPGGNSYVCNAGFFPSELPASYLSMNPHQRLVESTRPANGVFSNQLPQTVNCFLTGNQSMRVLGSRSGQPTCGDDIRDGLTQTIAFSENLQAGPWNSVGNLQGWSQVTIDGVLYAGDELDNQHASRIHVGMVWLYRSGSQDPGDDCQR